MSDQDHTTRDPEPAADTPTESESAMSNPTIKMYVQWVAADNEWCVDSSPSSNPKKKQKPIILADDSGGHEIEFHLHNPPAGWEFDIGDPIWTADNVNCGSLSNKTKSDQIKDVRPQATLLTIFDENDGDARLVRYQLNFVNKGSGPVPPACDPAILNGGKN
jgi:hypothetical protein